MNKYDVIIIGGGTAGCACAYNCAKLGLKTLLIEKSSCLGGTMTSGLVVPIMKSGENQINTDFYDILVKKMKNLGGQITYKNNAGWFNPELLKIALDSLLIETGVKILFNTTVDSTTINNNKILSIQLLKPANDRMLSVNTDTIYNDNIHKLKVKNNSVLSVCIEAKYYVDATGNLNFSKKINCEFLENLTFPPMSLRFIVGGVDLSAFSKWLLEFDPDRDVTTVETIDDEIHLSTACTWDTDKHWALAPLFDKAVKDHVLKDTDRNYFQLFTVAGMRNSVAFNCPRIVEPLNPNVTSDLSKALILGRQAIYRIFTFCTKYLPGFEKSYISNISDYIGIRSSNRIKGKYIYTIEDLRSGKKFKNPVLVSNYPVDVHSAKKDSSMLEQTGEYQLPIESLMSCNYENLFVAGRGVSADEYAQGALRVQASCFSMGEGVAKYIASLKN